MTQLVDQLCIITETDTRLPGLDTDLRLDVKMERSKAASEETDVLQPMLTSVERRRLSADEAAAAAAVNDDSDKDEDHVSLNDVDVDDDDDGFDPTLHVWHPPEDPVRTEEQRDGITTAQNCCTDSDSDTFIIQSSCSFAFIHGLRPSAGVGRQTRV